MSVSLKFKLNESLYLKDPQESNLGKKILGQGAALIHEIGLESFNFKKLAIKIGSSEKSIYRYFENKHYLLLFLTSWYWEYVYYLIDINLRNVIDPKKQLDIAIDKIVKARAVNPSIEYLSENILHDVIINEGSKSYHTFSVDDENEVGLFFSYKKLVKFLAAIVRSINPSFPYAESMSSNILEMSNNQFFFSNHLPALTNLDCNEGNEEELIKMMRYFCEKLLK